MQKYFAIQTNQTSIALPWDVVKWFFNHTVWGLPLVISLSPPQDDAPQEEWEDWDTMTVTVVPNNPPTDEGSGDPRMKYSTRQASSTENEPSAEELFHDMQPVYKKAKMVLFLQILAVYCIWDPILKSEHQYM